MSKRDLRSVFSTFKDEDEMTKTETEEKKIIDPNGDEVHESAAKHIIE